MNKELKKYVSRKELAQKCGLSVSSFYRKLKAKNINIPSGYISPSDQLKILNALGYFARKEPPKQLTDFER